MNRIKVLMLFACLILPMQNSWADVQAVGLMSGMAILEVDGQRVILKTGQIKQGVKLISVDSRQATIEYQGKQRSLSLSTSVAGGYSAPTKQVVRIPKGDRGHFFANARINGRMVKMLLDTGASHVAMSSDTARSLGIQYATGTRGRSSTAGGIVESFTLRLNEIQIGGIKKFNVLLSVIEGSHPSIPLLGMSFLNQVNMTEENGMMVLTD